jgi:succinyl-CoA synthetase alpha subunit
MSILINKKTRVICQGITWGTLPRVNLTFHVFTHI